MNQDLPDATGTVMHASEIASKRSTRDGFLGRRIGPETEANIRSIGSFRPPGPARASRI
ncbi:hypothetical protein FOPG_16243 [Fusarium oxysporum f. sp. conglutinans race 2 54008]|uniref:Uncharacterized protein n=1 Tax=Fusarium oxysporum f. sp. conglutinans race 2 54008 TaxID=1089457 RepID=X0I2X9_FUSOX|nr:hypothetical protein FOPG_16243 [Fusarium oxysporum f. sp. conglutinans race 2 54008]